MLALCRCEFCGNAFNSFGSKICADCSKAVDEAYVKIRKYIYQNPGKAHYSTIMEEADVSEKELSYLIKQGKIDIDNKVGIGNRCRSCGVETSVGSLCEQCRMKVLLEGLKPSPMKTEAPEKDRAQKAAILPISYNK